MTTMRTKPFVRSDLQGRGRPQTTRRLSVPDETISPLLSQTTARGPGPARQTPGEPTRRRQAVHESDRPEPRREARATALSTRGPHTSRRFTGWFIGEHRGRLGDPMGTKWGPRGDPALKAEGMRRGSSPIAPLDSTSGMAQSFVAGLAAAARRKAFPRCRPVDEFLQNGENSDSHFR
jgi:hypothetical protein